MTSLLLSAVLAAAYPPPPPIEPAKLPGIPPTVLVAQIDGEKLLITRSQLLTKYEQRTITRQVGNETVQETVAVPVLVQVPEVIPFPVKDVKAFDAANKPIDAEKVAERLKAATPVVISTDGQPVAEAYRKLLKDDAILLTLPHPLPPMRQAPPPPPDKVPPPPPPPDKAPKPVEKEAARAFAADEPKGKDVKFDTHNGYFESNKSGLKGDASFLVLTDAKGFDAIFGKARTMGPKPNFIEDGAWEKKIAIATIQRGMKMVTYKVDKVTAEDGVLTIAYTTTSKDSTSATFASPLIVTVDKGDYKSVVFIENGKKAGTAEFPKEK
jgi:hypothetical protein